MFNNRAFQVRVVKTNSDPSPTAIPTHFPIDLDKINKIMKEQVVNAALVTVAATAAVHIIDALCKIAVNKIAPNA